MVSQLGPLYLYLKYGGTNIALYDNLNACKHNMKWLGTVRMGNTSMHRDDATHPSNTWIARENSSVYI
jgi:uncharacterized Fe-S cluster protein YjdI